MRAKRGSSMASSMGNELNDELQTIWDEAKGHIERGDYDRAIDIYKYLLLRYADNDIVSEYASAYLGDVFLTTRSFDVAEKYLKAIGYAPQKPHYHYLLGFTHYAMRRWRQAVRECKAALAMQPDNGEYERALGWAMFEAGVKSRVETDLYRASELAPKDVNILTDIGSLALGNFDKAKEYAKKAIAVDPGHDLAGKLLENSHHLDEIRKKRR